MARLECERRGRPDGPGRCRFRMVRIVVDVRVGPQVRDGDRRCQSERSEPEACGVKRIRGLFLGGGRVDRRQDETNCGEQREC